MLEKFKDAQFPIISIPFHNELVEVKVRELTQAQIQACGGNNFSLIETVENKARKRKKISMQERVDYAAMQAKIAKKTLIEPTYEEIFNICNTGKDIESINAQMVVIDSQMALIPDSKERQDLANDYNKKRIWFDLILPEDFLAALTCYALGIDKSDIKEVTKQSLLSAAVSAKEGHDNPADHLDGLFTPYMKEDINKRAWAYYYEEKKKRNKK
jgi:hypothetical protein